MPKIHIPGDAMSDVLALIRLRPESCQAQRFSDTWSVHCHERMGHFHIVERGEVLLVVGRAKPVSLIPGDVAILARGTGHVLTNDPRQRTVAIDRYAAVDSGARRETAAIVWGQFSFAGVLAPRLLKALPPLIHVQASRTGGLEWLHLNSSFLVEEARYPKPGSATMIARLMELLFIQSIRHWGSKSLKNVGWLAGLKEPTIGRALSAIHERPAEPWTVAALAQVAGQSRSAFATRFAEIVGQTPLRYLTTWRLNLAAELLRSAASSVSEIATLVGYGSEAALTRAFRSEFGTTPGRFRRAGSDFTQRR